MYSIDRVGLLSEVTRLLRENGLTVLRADVSTQGNTAFNTFYVTDACGGPVDMKVVDAIRHVDTLWKQKVFCKKKTSTSCIKPSICEGGRRC